MSITGDDDSRVSTATGGGFNAMADGSDTIYGGAGNDEIHTGSWADGDDGFDNSHTGNSFDWAYGGDGDDILRGDNGRDFLRGDAGNDNIGGGGGADSLVGAEGDDVLNGGSGTDLLNGGRGRDYIFAVDGWVDFIVGDRHEAVDLPLDLVNTVQDRLRQLDRRNLAAVQQSPGMVCSETYGFRWLHALLKHCLDPDEVSLG